ncbi:MAG: orotidine-5'-phosphate decarboxylase [Thermoplasmata archaeon]|nr:orotidine-5'-phosphate decarboxylase [Thermoplasmata archaeon]
MKSFSDRLMDAIDAKENPSCVGLDPRFDSMPQYLREQCRRKYGETFEAVAECFLEFNKAIIDAIRDEVVAVKPQMAFYEAYGAPGVNAFKETADYAKKHDLLVIEDAKRGDIGETAKAYSDGHIGKVKSWRGMKECFDVDAITVNPYLGFDGIKPFVEDSMQYGKGAFVLVKTSNPSSGQLQDTPIILEHPSLPELQRRFGDQSRLRLSELKELIDAADETVIAPNYVRTASFVDDWGEVCRGVRGYSSIGAVVGATYPEEARTLRKLMPSTYFLAPGYGVQGGNAADAAACFNTDGYGAIVSSSRAIMYAYRDETGGNICPEEEFDVAAKAAAIAMKEDLVSVLRQSDKCPW